MVKYVFRDTPLTIKNASKADPQRFGEALEKIAADNDGHIKPAKIVEVAKEPRHVFHKHFEWNVEKAAMKHWLDTAREIVQSVHVTEASVESGHIRGFLSITQKQGTSYRTLKEIKTSADLQMRVLEQALRDLQAFETRYQNLKDVCAVVQQAREILAAKMERGRKKAAGENRASA